MSLKQGWGASALLLAFCDGRLGRRPGRSGTGVRFGRLRRRELPRRRLCHGQLRVVGARCCCPKICFPLEKPPCIKFKCICPKPVCEPCNLDGYGYYATCWHPWPYPPNCGYYPAPAARRGGGRGRR